jgi:SWI/SNF-related matrix-associated actin-dependent regulator 1 of chromatin subfamily A
MTIHPSAYKVTFPFGKYKGMSYGYIAELDSGYLNWIIKTESMPAPIRTNASKTLSGAALNAPQTSVMAESMSTPTIKMWAVKKDMVAVTFPYNEELKNRFKYTVDGTLWNKKEYRWEFPAVHLPRAIEFFGGTSCVIADDKVKNLYKEELDRRAKLDEIRKKPSTELDIKSLKLPLYDYQKVAVEFIEAAGGRCIDADQMGLVKTPTAIGYAEKNKYKTLIVCPKSVKTNWARELKKFADQEACIWEPTGHIGNKRARYHIVNYDIISRYIEEFQKLEFDLLVCDEATYLKNYRSIRSKTIFGYWKEKKTYPGLKIPKVLFLTGTPILNKPMEAYTLLSFLDKKRFANPKHFIQRYGIAQHDQPKNLDELHERTKDLVIRRLKSQVSKEMPKKIRSNMYVEMSQSEHKAYNRKIDDLFKIWKNIGNPSAAQMPAIRNFLFDIKWDRIIEFIDEMLDSGRGLLVFTIQQEHAERLVKHYGDTARLLTGKTSSKDRQTTIDDLSSGTAKLGVFTIMAGGMGINGLQQSISDVLFVDRWFVPAIHEQAEDRVHRDGQKNAVTVWYLTVEGTIDEIMADILTDKQIIIDTVVDGGLVNQASGKSIFKDVVKKMLQNRLDGKDFDIDEVSEYEVE